MHQFVGTTTDNLPLACQVQAFIGHLIWSVSQICAYISGLCDHSVCQACSSLLFCRRGTWNWGVKWLAEGQILLSEQGIELRYPDSLALALSIIQCSL